MTDLSPAPLVSVIVPCHNAREFVRTAVDSILNQSYQNVEVIVVDDGSADNSKEQLDPLLDRILLIQQPNRGPASARNAGLKAAKGEFVAFLDADDAWHPRKLEVQVNHLLANPECGIVYGRWLEWRCDDDGKWIQPSWPDENLLAPAIIPAESGWLYLTLLLDSVIHTSSVMFRSSVLRRVGLFQESLRKGQDLDYWLRASRISPVHKLDATLSLYRIYATSLTFRPVDKNYHALIVQHAIETWGLTDIDGRSLDRAAVNRMLLDSWKAFGARHLRSGSPRIARSAARSALAIDPTDVRAWRLLWRSTLRSLTGSDAASD